MLEIRGTKPPHHTSILKQYQFDAFILLTRRIERLSRCHPRAVVKTDRRYALPLTCLRQPSSRTAQGFGPSLRSLLSGKVPVGRYKILVLPGFCSLVSVSNLITRPTTTQDRRAGERRGFCQAELSPSFRWGDGFMKSRAMSRFSRTAMSLRWDDGGGWKRKEKGCEIRWPSQIRGDGRWMPPCFPVGCFLIRRPGERRGLGSG